MFDSILISFSEVVKMLAKMSKYTVLCRVYILLLFHISFVCHFFSSKTNIFKHFWCVFSASATTQYIFPKTYNPTQHTHSWFHTWNDILCIISYKYKYVGTEVKLASAYSFILGIKGSCHTNLYYKQGFAISGNVLPFNMGTEYHRHCY